jgi:hypothetical protein
MEENNATMVNPDIINRATKLYYFGEVYFQKLERFR